MATDNAQSIVRLEESLSVGVEDGVQGALDGSWLLWILNHLYLAAQMVVVPGALVWLYRRSRTRYELLRKVLAWLWAPTVGLAVVATGNHFVADIVAGLAVTALGFAVGRAASVGLARGELPGLAVGPLHHTGDVHA